MTKKFIAIVLSLMVLTSCASKIQETSLIQVSNTEGLPDSLKGINDARLHARADYHTETSGMQRRSLLTGPPTYRVQQFQDKTDAYIQAYMDEYPKEIERLGTVRSAGQAVTMIFVGLGVLALIVLLAAASASGSTY